MIIRKTEKNDKNKRYGWNYKRKRKLEYGSIEEQIEYIVENGLDAFISKQNAIKSKYPK